MVGRAALQNALLPLVDFYMDKTKRIIGAHGTDHDKLVILGLTNGPIPIPIGRAGYVLRNDVTISTATDMDTGTIASGKDYYVYAVMDQGLELE
jgi:hypothetical protein